MAYNLTLLSTSQYLAVFDPISWLVAHWGVSTATAILIAAGGVVIIVFLTLAIVIGWIKQIRLEHRQTKYTKILHDNQIQNNINIITVVCMDSNGKVTDGRIFKAENIDDDLKKILTNNTVIKHS